MPGVRRHPEHGTRQRYMHRHYKCRCSLCKDANAEYMSHYRKQKRRHKEQEYYAAAHNSVVGTGRREW